MDGGRALCMFLRLCSSPMYRQIHPFPSAIEHLYILDGLLTQTVDWINGWQARRRACLTNTCARPQVNILIKKLPLPHAFRVCSRRCRCSGR